MTKLRQMPVVQLLEHHTSRLIDRTYHDICEQQQEHIVFRPQDLVEEAEGEAGYKSADESWQADIEEPFSGRTFCEVVKHKNATADAEHGKINNDIDLGAE